MTTNKVIPRLIILLCFVGHKDAASTLVLENQPSDIGITVNGNHEALSRDVNVEFKTEGDTLGSILNLLVPVDWDAYIEETNSFLFIKGEYNGYWLDVISEILEDQNLHGSVNVKNKSIRITNIQNQ